MKVNLFSFIDPLTRAGGGEMITRALISAGRGRGHDIRVSAVRPKRADAHDSPDLTILVDIHNVGHTWRSLGAWRGFSMGSLQEAVSSGRFVHLSNAYVDACNLPYLPCGGARGETDRCPAKTSKGWARRTLLLRDASNSCFARHARTRWLFERAALNVYLSPLHQRVTEGLLGLEAAPPSYVLPPLIDTEMFRNTGGERDIDYLFVGVISEAKGLAEMRRRFSRENIVLLGRCAPGVQLDFGLHVAHVPYAEVPQYMNRAKNFVFLPRWPEPQGRVVAEAALCGCNIIGSDLVGALSFGHDLSDPAHYRGVEASFWARVESIPI